MPRLIVNPDSEAAWEIELKPGAISLGRETSNDVPVEHPSVSSRHCQITTLSSGVLVKDLGSTGGTFLDGELVEEALLLTGQTLRLGDVTMRFESDLPATTTMAAVSSTVVAAAPTKAACKNHPKAVGTYHCAQCDETFCEMCVNSRVAGGRPARFCRACGGRCEPLQAETDNEAPAFTQLIGGAFSYPFKHDGIILLVCGTIFYSFMSFLASHASIFGLFVTLFGTGYLFSYMQRILQASASGENRMPDWPDFSDWGDVTAPILPVFGTILVSFGPLILLKIFANTDAPWPVWVYPAAIAWGCAYFPMSFTAVTMFDSLGALNPLLIIPSILRIFAAYLLAVVLLVGIFFANGLGADLLEKILPIPIMPGIISLFLGLYLLTVEMRILGLLYWSKKAELGWFRR